MKITQRQIIKTSLVLFLFLFATLFIIDKNTELKTTTIANISTKHINKNIKTQGQIIRQTLKNTTLFLTIQNQNTKNHNKTLKAIAFKTNKTLQKNTNYTFEGKISLYNMELEMIVNKIEKI